MTDPLGSTGFPFREPVLRLNLGDGKDPEEIDDGSLASSISGTGNVEHLLERLEKMKEAYQNEYAKEKNFGSEGQRRLDSYYDEICDYVSENHIDEALLPGRIMLSAPDVSNDALSRKSLDLQTYNKV